MRKQLVILVLAFLSLSVMAQGQKGLSNDSSHQSSKGSKGSSHQSAIFTGFSGGMMVHIGYAFSDDPRKVFSNTGLGSEAYVNSLPRGGVSIGLGGTLRVHLLDHIHVGAEGGVSTMPLMGTGSNIRTGWGGAMCDYYFHCGKVRPLLGMVLGGGAMQRLYVPDQALNTPYTSGSELQFNASYTKSGFFLMDPYVGMEIDLNSHMALLLRIDYMLPFGKTGSSLTQSVKWSSFMTPTGPRLYVGIMFGKLGN